ncbi:MAG: hypothetical protein HQK83_06200 [Fibrobacteria bacterium]|nr:hypothetical protein [Fibrobacteria bacterium]
MLLIMQDVITRLDRVIHQKKWRFSSILLTFVRWIARSPVLRSSAATEDGRRAMTYMGSIFLLMTQPACRAMTFPDNYFSLLRPSSSIPLKGNYRD